MLKPKEVTDLEITFGGDMDVLLPKWDDIPEEFKFGHTRWNKVISDWFFMGLKDVDLTPKESINANSAIRHIKAILSSFDPKHEHKEAGCAYLMSCFFEDIIYKTNN